MEKSSYGTRAMGMESAEKAKNSNMEDMFLVCFPSFLGSGMKFVYFSSHRPGRRGGPLRLLHPLALWIQQAAGRGTA